MARQNEPKGDDYASAYGRERGTLRTELTAMLSECTITFAGTERKAYLS